MGDFIQLRVRPQGKSITLDNLERRLTDTGAPIDLPPATRARVLEALLNRAELWPYWHVDRKGRDTLRILKSPPVPQTLDFKMFGSPVVWIDSAPKDEAYLQILAFEGTASELRVRLGFAAEGIVADAVLEPLRYSIVIPKLPWSITEVRVSEQAKH
jgi:hypothetical protein